MNTIPTGEQLLEEARQKTGLSNFGSGTFQEGFGKYLQSLHEEMVSPANVSQLLTTARRRLVNRLEIEELVRTHPEIATLPIEGPVSITGLPRTGTTPL